MPTKRRTKKTETKNESPVVHPEIKADLRAAVKNSDGPPLSIDDAKELIGWTEELDGEDWGKKFDLKDTFGRKVRLTNNPNNRPLRLSEVKENSLVFLKGEWRFNGETLVVGKSGVLRDGQHRLVGFILAEQQRQIDQKKYGSDPLAFSTVVVYGIDEEDEVIDTIDIGIGRSGSDVIFRRYGFDGDKTAQKKIATVVDGAARLVWLRAGGKKVSGGSKLTHTTKLELLKNHPGIVESVMFIMKLDHGAGDENEKNLFPGMISLGYASALHYLMHDVNKRDADKFWRSLASGEGLEKGSPVLALSKFLTTAKAGSGAQRDDLVGACVKAWLAFKAGEELTPKAVKVKKTKDDENGKFVPAEFPRIGGVDSEPETVEELDIKAKMVLSCLCDSEKDEMSYDEIADTTGLSRSLVGRICASDRHDNLMSTEKVTVNVYEAENGPDTVAVSVTDKGRKEVR